MPNEKKTESLVRKLLEQRGYYNNESVLVEENSSDNPKIDKLLKGASKSGGKGKGFPEFIISFHNYPEILIVIECKADTTKHESQTRKIAKHYAVDGALLYASYLNKEFNVLAIAVSGETAAELCVSQFTWLKGRQTYKDLPDDDVLNPKSVLSLIEKESEPIKQGDLIAKAIEYNGRLAELSVPELDRCKLISSILVALQDKVFASGYREYFMDIDNLDYNPNEDLVDGLIEACKRVLNKNRILDRKASTILHEYNSIKQVNAFTVAAHPDPNISEPNRVLRDLIDDLNQSVMPYVNQNVYDILGQFYTQFIRYAGSDSSTGLVLTPPHITELFCDLASLTKDDIVFDPCCGTGGFLVSAMKYMVEDAGNNQIQHRKIKSNRLIGIEDRPDMFTHACSNMMMRGDGKSNIHFGSCYNKNITRRVKSKKPTKAFLNPPYNVGEVGQLRFIENALNILRKDGVCVAICQMSAVISGKNATIEMKKSLLKKHTLEAVLSMPDDLFHPAAGVITCIVILKAHTPHPARKKTFFGYFKEDGFIKAKKRGRVDEKDQWQGIKSKWLNSFINKETIPGLSLTHQVDGNAEWCAEEYMDTDYSTLTDEDYIKTIRDYVAFQFLSEKKK